MAAALLVLTFVLAIADWIGTERGWVKPRYFTKPATILVLIAWFSVSHGWARRRCDRPAICSG